MTVRTIELGPAVCAMLARGCSVVFTAQCRGRVLTPLRAEVVEHYGTSQQDVLAGAYEHTIEAATVNAFEALRDGAFDRSVEALDESDEWAGVVAAHGTATREAIDPIHTNTRERHRRRLVVPKTTEPPPSTMPPADENA